REVCPGRGARRAARDGWRELRRAGAWSAWGGRRACCRIAATEGWLLRARTGLQQEAQLLQSDAQPALHRSERNALERGDFLLGAAGEVGQLDRLALHGRDARERGADLGALHVLVRGLEDVGPLRIGDRLVQLGGRALPLGAAQAVDAAMVGDGEQPAAWRAAGGVVAVGAAPGGEKGFLQRVLGRRP